MMFMNKSRRRPPLSSWLLLLRILVESFVFFVVVIIISTSTCSSTRGDGGGGAFGAAVASAFGVVSSTPLHRAAAGARKPTSAHMLVIDSDTGAIFPHNKQRRRRHSLDRRTTSTITMLPLLNRRNRHAQQKQQQQQQQQRQVYSRSSSSDEQADPTASCSSSIIPALCAVNQEGSIIRRQCWARSEVLHSLLLLNTLPTLLLMTTATTPCPCWSMEENIDYSHGGRGEGDVLLLRQTTTSSLCQSGALMAETAIPGAYEQDCMKLPVRIVPVTIPPPLSLSLRSKQQTLRVEYLQMEQGSAAAGTTGLAVWNSSLLLSRLLSRLAAQMSTTMSSSTSTSTSTSFLQNQHVVELGCGTGLVSLTAALLGAARVVATDGNPNVVALAQRNIQSNRNRVSSSSPLSLCDISARQLSWGLMDAMDNSDETTTTTTDWVIGSDLTYNAASWRILAETMATILQNNNNNGRNDNNSFALYLTLGHAGFDVNAEMDGFLTVAQEQGLQQVQPGDVDWPFAGSTTTSLTSLLLQECIATPEERSIVAATGGARVVLLRCKTRNMARRRMTTAAA